jgi:DNA polymerase IV (DinB-like DNA polymerase)
MPTRFLSPDMSGERLLPGAPDEDEERVVLHVDMDCFYASCERLREPTLAGKPVVVGMGYEDGADHGAVATASYEARAYGVESAQPISAALEALPRVQDARADPDGSIHEAGYYRPVDLEHYQSVADDVKEILHDCADVVREVSIDEAYLDVTERTAWDAVPDDPDRTLAEGYARHVKQRIDREVGVPASVGVAPNMSTAKVASDHDKPDGLVVVRPGEVREFLAPLPVEEVHGVGPVTANELDSLGIETAGDLAGADPTVLRERFGERGREFHERARGRDDREVTPTGRPKSLSRESAYAEPTDSRERKREKVRALAADVAERARSKGVMYRTIGIKVVTPPYDVNTRASSLPGPVDDPDLVAEVALDLLTEFGDDRVRKLGVRVSKLSFDDADQSRLDGWDGNGDVDDGDGRADADPEAAAGQRSLVDFD